MNGGVERKDACFRGPEQDRLARPELEQRLRDQTLKLEHALARQHYLAQQLEEEKRRSGAVEAAIPLALFESDRQGRIRNVNPAFVRLTRFTLEKIGGRSWCEVLISRADPQIVRNCKGAVQEQRPYVAEMQISRADGSSLWVLINAIPKFDAEGSFCGHIGTLTDITRQIQLLQALKDNERRLSEVSKEAELAMQAKSKFLDAASHDLRQPLQAASLFIAVLQNRVGEEQRRLILDKLQLSLNTLENLLKALLEVSELEAELGQPIASVFPVRELFFQLASEFAESAAEKRLRLRMVAPSLYLRTDRGYLERLLRNLLTNALSCTSEGKVLLGARRSGKSLRIEIWDTGESAPAPERENMVQNFDPFRTEHREEGLEVARAKRIARLLDSRLIIRTGPGRCSVSAFELPMALVSNQMDPRMSGWSPIQQNTGKVIVVIDDEVSVQESLALLLADWGHLPVVDSTAAGILDQLARRPVSPDLIIADYQLANGQLGTKAIAEIRHSCGGQIPAIMLTGDIAPERHISAQQKSYVLLHKPIGPEHLRVILGSLLGNRT
jgi:PAS domain S-box-containing protein